MLIEIKQLEGMAVGALDEGALVGKVLRTVVDPRQIRLIGFTVRTGTFWPKVLAVSFSDVVDVDKNGAVINSKESLVEKNEIVRLGELIKIKFSLVGLPVYSRNRKRLGTVTDAVAETLNGDILRIYVQSLFEKRVFARSQIEKMTLTEVVIRDLAQTSVATKQAEEIVEPA